MGDKPMKQGEVRALAPWRRRAATVGPVIVVVLLGALTLLGHRREQLRANAVLHTQQVLLMLERTLLDLREAETGQRSYVLTGDTAYLNLFSSAVRSVGTHMDTTRRLTSDNAAQQARLRVLSDLVTRRLQFATQTVDQYRQGQPSAAANMIRSGKGRVMMDSIRAVIQALEDEETALLARRTAEADRASRLTAIGVLAGTLVAGGLAFLINLVLGNYAAAQESSARKLAEQNELLQENTVELELQRDELQRVTDELVLRTAAAEEANRAKMSFLRSISHELRTPLNAIGGYAELLELGIRGPLTEAQRQDLKRIIESQRHLLSLINDILNFAKLEAGRVHFEIRPCPVQEILAGIAPFVRPQIELKGLTLESSLDGADLAVEADPEKVRQILLNLLSNAIKFTPAGGRIAIEITQAPETVAIHVTDTGIGIPRDRIDSVFEPFVQVHRTLSKSTEGTGLGLAISRELARGMNGDLTVVSEPNRGSDFTLELPRAAKSAGRK